jgi:hypothetical protein
MDLQATLAAASLLGGPPRYEEQPLPFGRLLGRNGFKYYRYFSVADAPQKKRRFPGPHPPTSLEMGFERTRHSARRTGIGNTYGSQPGLRYLRPGWR